MSAIDRVTSGAEGLHVEVPSDITAAFEQAMGSLQVLVEACKLHSMDPMSMIATMLSGAAAGSAQAPPIVLPKPSTDAIERSHELIDALDRGDAATVDATLARAFLYFDGGRIKDRSAILATIRQRRSLAPHIESRTWVDERVIDRGDTIVFIGKAHEVQGGNKTHGGYLHNGWYLIQWVRAGEAWQVHLLTWQKETTERDWWDDTFLLGRGFSREPNRLLVSTVADVRPGTALELATGQGRNALYLASRGWSVTGVDASAEALRIAGEEAARRELALETVHADVDEWSFGKSRYDLITLMYAGDDARWIERIKLALRPGGLFVVEGWARDEGSSFGFGESQLRDLFDGYEILVDETVEDVPDWAYDVGKLVRFVARKSAP